ncbi:MAG TPA: hypothetical protein VNS88_13360, partial [Nitrospiraceae bacterium]|nr:hypothetical protein [Nitrospiraceae bacterium]
MRWHARLRLRWTDEGVRPYTGGNETDRAPTSTNFSSFRITLLGCNPYQSSRKEGRHVVEQFQQP